MRDSFYEYFRNHKEKNKCTVHEFNLDFGLLYAHLSMFIKIIIIKKKELTHGFVYISSCDGMGCGFSWKCYI
jgi:hypothetical protein